MALLSYLEHNLGKQFLIILSKLLKSNFTKLREENQSILSHCVGHVYHLLLQDVQAEGDQRPVQVLVMSIIPTL